MADEKEADAVVTEKEQTEEASETKVDVNALAKQVEELKKLQSGSDKAYSEASRKLKALEAENERLKIEKMTEEEKAKHEITKEREELEKVRRENREATLHLSTMKALSAKNVDQDFAEFVTGDDEETITAKIDKLDELIKRQVSKGVEQVLSGTSKPKAGGESSEGKKALPTDFSELEKIFRSNLKT
jgi:predicted RNase H-like nuclease (RuvC/YqgF family)